MATSYELTEQYTTLYNETNNYHKEIVKRKTDGGEDWKPEEREQYHNRLASLKELASQKRDAVDLETLAALKDNTEAPRVSAPAKKYSEPELRELNEIQCHWGAGCLTAYEKQRAQEMGWNLDGNKIEVRSSAEMAVSNSSGGGVTATAHTYDPVLQKLIVDNFPIVDLCRQVSTTDNFYEYFKQLTLVSGEKKDLDSSDSNQITQKQPTYGNGVFPLFEYDSGFCPIKRKLLASARVDFQSEINQQQELAMLLKVNDDLTNGAGTGIGSDTDLTGILTNAEVAVTLGVDGLLEWTDIVDLETSRALSVQNKATTRHMAHPKTIGYIRSWAVQTLNTPFETDMLTQIFTAPIVPNSAMIPIQDSQPGDVVWAYGDFGYVNLVNNPSYTWLLRDDVSLAKQGGIQFMRGRLYGGGLRDPKAFGVIKKHAGGS